MYIFKHSLVATVVAISFLSSPIALAMKAPGMSLPLRPCGGGSLKNQMDFRGYTHSLELNRAYLRGPSSFANLKFGVKGAGFTKELVAAKILPERISGKRDVYQGAYVDKRGHWPFAFLVEKVRYKYGNKDGAGKPPKKSPAPVAAAPVDD